MMNFSNSMKPPHKRRGTYWRDLVLGFIVGALVALLIGLAVSKITTVAKADQDFPAETPADSSPLWTVQPSPVEIPTEVPATTPPQTLFRVTAYCACEKCCGEWAKNRPNGVVYGAAGIELVAGVFTRRPPCPLEPLLKWKAWVNMWFRIAPPNGLLRNTAKTSLIFTLITMKKPVPSACNI